MYVCAKRLWLVSAPPRFSSNELSYNRSPPRLYPFLQPFIHHSLPAFASSRLVQYTYPTGRVPGDSCCFGMLHPCPPIAPLFLIPGTCDLVGVRVMYPLTYKVEVQLYMFRIVGVLAFPLALLFPREWARYVFHEQNFKKHGSCCLEHFVGFDWPRWTHSHVFSESAGMHVASVLLLLTTHCVFSKPVLRIILLQTPIASFNHIIIASFNYCFFYSSYFSITYFNCPSVFILIAHCLVPPPSCACFGQAETVSYKRYLM